MSIISCISSQFHLSETSFTKQCFSNRGDNSTT